jgi:hypothetical protein
MTGRFVLVTLLAVGCAAAVPAAHGAFGGDRLSMHGDSPHAGFRNAEHGPEEMRAHVAAALDTLDLAPEKRAKVAAVIESHFDEAAALHEKLRSGELDHAAALAEHDRIVATVKAELAPVLTADEIRRLEAALHPQGAGR